MAGDDPGRLAGYREQPVRRKEERAHDGRPMSGDADKPGTQPGGRLPPGQREVKNWPVLDLGVRPEIAAAEWRLRVDGLVAAPVVWDWDAFMAQPQVTLTSDIHCVTGWSRFDNAWTGVHIAHLLEIVRPKDEARHCVFHGHDNYTANVRIERFADEDALLAHSWNGAPLEPAHGGPVRAVIPKRYFWKSAKWIKRIEFRRDDAPGFWEIRGYHNEGDPWAEQRYE